MNWYTVILLCIISCWAGMFLMALFSNSKCGDCKARELNDIILKCKKCGMDNLHIVNRFNCLHNEEDFIIVCHTCGTEYEMSNDIKNHKEVQNNEN